MRIRLLPIVLPVLISCFFYRTTNFVLISTSHAVEQPAASPPPIEEDKTKKEMLVQDLTAGRDKLADEKINNLTISEIEALQNLVQRRKELEAREEELELREKSLKALEQSVQNKINELSKIQIKVEEVLNAYQVAEDEKILALVKVYEAMKPVEAAKIFDQIEIQILIPIVANMNEAKLAAVLAKMDPYRAKEITIALTNYRSVKND